MAKQTFLSEKEQSMVVKAIEQAELNTSGEIRVHIESSCPGDPVTRAISVFNQLKMNRTKERNAVLIYIAWKSHKFAIIGDSGINEKVPENFWEQEKEILLDFLKQGKAAEGLVQVIDMAGTNLKKYFEYQTNDINEQSNDISFGN
ncbi:MAG: TPM domain-containing protein [Bacteroidia bacterium]|nr:TPM domain-containing protein [Bacteroidia bacterium]